MAAVGVGLRLPLGGECRRAVHVDSDEGRELVQAVSRAGRKEGFALLVDAHGAPRRVGGVEQRLRGGVGVGRAEHAGAQPIARDDVSLVQRQVGHELHGSAGAVGR